ncbi:cytochrome P450 [Irpex lacteus]|nr:cytochrome P450 [Irpex lacteus]
MGTIILATAVLAVFFILRTIVNFRKAVLNVRNHPGYRHLGHSNGAIGIVLQKRHKGLVLGGFWPWLEKYEPYRRFGVDVITAVSALPTPDTVVWVADAENAREVLTSRPRFVKPIEFLQFLDVFGGNIVSSEGEEWKRHRRVCAPSFSEPNNRLVFEETVLVMKDLFADVWGTETKEINVPHMVNITHAVALYVIGKAGFGRPVSWKSDSHDDADTSPKRTNETAESLSHVTNSLMFRALLPSWLYLSDMTPGPLKRVREMRRGFDEFESHMTDMINARVNPSEDEQQERRDLFSNLLKASDFGQAGKGQLSKNELFGNIFLFLFAGESTAHTMAFVFGLLAIYQDEQEIVYEQLKEVLEGGRDPTYYDMDKLTRCTAVVNEALRMYAPVILALRCAGEDTSLTTTNHLTGENVVLPIPKGTKVAVNVTALHYNPRYWDDPHEFKPERFFKGDWNRDAFQPFSLGARACIGKRFVELELAAAIATTISKYKVELPPDVLYPPSETLRARRERVLQCKYGNTLTPISVPLVFKRRE